MRRYPHLTLCLLHPFSTFTVQGEPKEDYPSKIRVDYQLNPCQAIPIPEGGDKTHCKAGTWVCQDTKLVPDAGDPKTLFLRTIAGSAPASDKNVDPLVVRADRIENVKECKSKISHPQANVEGTVWLHGYSSFSHLIHIIVPWNLTLKGGNFNGQDQSAVITFICDMAVVRTRQQLVASADHGMRRQASNTCTMNVITLY